MQQPVRSRDFYPRDEPRRPDVPRPEPQIIPPMRYERERVAIITSTITQEHPLRSFAGSFRGNPAWEAVKEEMRKAREQQDNNVE